jgi:hypothetical protein
MHILPLRRFADISVVCVALVACVTPPTAAQAFEGVLTMHQGRFAVADLMPAERGEVLPFLKEVGPELRARLATDSSAEETSVTYYIKGGRLRSTSPTGPGAGPEYLIMDLDTGVYRIVQPTQGLVIEWNRRTAADGNADSASSLGNAVEPFEEGRVINGFRCTGYATDDSNGIVEVSWLTGDMPELTEAFTQLAELSRSLGASATASRRLDRFLQHGFPVLTLTFDRTDGMLTIAEVEHVERQPLEAAMFEPPPGFATVSVQP